MDSNSFLEKRVPIYHPLGFKDGNPTGRCWFRWIQTANLQEKLMKFGKYLAPKMKAFHRFRVKKHIQASNFMCEKKSMPANLWKIAVFFDPGSLPIFWG